MRVLITGSNGFVGGYLAAELDASGFELRLSDRSPESRNHFPYRAADLCDESQVKGLIEWSQADFVVHLAGIADVGAIGQQERASRIASGNVSATHYLCEALAKQSKSSGLLLISSGLVYKPENHPQFAGYTEESELGPVNDYGWSKLAAEAIARIYNQTSLKCYIARPFNHIGPGQDLRFVCPSLAKRVFEAKEGDSIPVGNLRAERDFSDVRDIVRAYRLILEKQPEERLFVLGSGQAIPIQNILDFFLEYSGKRLNVVTSPDLLRTEHDRVFSCADRARDILGWKGEIALKTTLQDIYDAISRAKQLR